MTLVIAAAGQHEVIIGAERLCPLGDDDGRYGIGVSKIRLLGNVGFGFAGWRSGIALFDTAKEKYPIKAGVPLHEEIKAFLGVMSRAYSDFANSSDDIRVVACGVDGGKPLIYTARLFCGGSSYPTHHIEGRVAVGLEKHGALHFLHTYHRPDMSTSELAFLVYFSISETIRHDTRVRGPIDMYVVREGETKPLKQEQVKVLDIATRKTTKRIGTTLSRLSPDIGA